jgi:serine/threonine protein kinase
MRSILCPPNISHYLTSPIGAGDGGFIGSGAFSTVRLIRDPVTGKCVAVKHIREPFDHHLFIREVVALVQLNHPCVVRICKWALPDGHNEAQIHMEYAEGRSLAYMLQLVNADLRREFWTPTRKGIIVCGIVLGMRCVHSRGIIHRDLKPSNILLNGKGQPMIADFGTSWMVYDDATPSGGPGTICYAAPEMYEEAETWTNKCDVFSFGLVLYEILTGGPVFHPSEPPFQIIRRLRAQDLPHLPSERGAFMQTLIQECWQQDHENRPSFQDILARFQTVDFAILPAADANEIGDFCRVVLDWERQAGL